MGWISIRTDPASGESMNALIEARNITKVFPGTLALNKVNFNLLPGEIHAIVGENGAGKSTLMLLMAGVYQPDGGELLIEGQPISLRDPLHSQRKGISTVFQDLALAPNMSVAENVFTNCQPASRAGWIRFEHMYAETQKALEIFGVQINPKAPLRNYSVAIQQIVEIARAIQRKARVLILDEPTSAIGEREIEKLLQILKMLRDRGVSIIYVSHKLNEVFAISDRITVLKDGNLVSTLRTADTSQDAVVNMMVGRELSELFPPPQIGGQRKTVLKVKNLSGYGFSNVSLDLHSGEILGIFGLTGAGRTELARGIFGAAPVIAGEILINDQAVKFEKPHQAMNRGIAYIPEDRKQDGLFYEMSFKKNTAAACLRELSGHIFMRRSKEETLARNAMNQLGIKARSIEQPVAGLSGGNQQKVLFAKWLARNPKVLIADEPTRGVDVGAKAEIHALLRKLANDGAVVVMISSELPEVLGMSDRVAVMRDKRLMVVLDRNQATEELVASYALGTIGESEFSSEQAANKMAG
jgi:ABC-type sugar transport system ATPase subunit